MAPSAQIIQFLLSPVAASGVTLSGGQAFFFAAGTSTPKTVWLDRNKTTEAANPYTLDANGTAQLYGDGVYRIVIQDSTGAVKFDLDYLNFADNGADLTGITSRLLKNVSEYADLAAAVSAIGSTTVTLAYNADQSLAADIVIPATLELLPLNGAVINHGTASISYGGSTGKWPLAQIFNGTGAVTGLRETRPEWFGGGTGASDNKAAIDKCQTAVNGTVTDNDRGGNVLFGPGVYLTSGNSYKSYVHFRGAGAGATVLRLTANTTANVVTVPTSSTANGLTDMTVDGNKTNNVGQGGHGIFFEATLVSSEGSTALYNKASQSLYSYKHFFLDRFAVSNCTGDGVHVESYNFAVYAGPGHINHNDGHGLYNGGTDSIYTDLLYERNGKAGIYNIFSGGNNKYANSKVIWNGMKDDTFGAVRNDSKRCSFIGIETQDNYTSGFINTSSDNMFVGCISDSNGYDKTLGANTSANTHSGFNITGADNSFVACKVTNYHAAVLSGNGLYPHLYPFRSTQKQYVMDISYTADSSNSPPDGGYATMFLRGRYKNSSLELRHIEGGSAESTFYIDPVPQDGTKGSNIVLFRNVNTTADPVLYVSKGDGTTGAKHAFHGKGNAELCISGGNYNNGHITLGPYHIWIEASTGKLRIKDSTPASDNDGTVIGPL